MAGAMVRSRLTAPTALIPGTGTMAEEAMAAAATAAPIPMTRAATTAPDRDTTGDNKKKSGRGSALFYFILRLLPADLPCDPLLKRHVPGYLAGALSEKIQEEIPQNP